MEKKLVSSDADILALLRQAYVFAKPDHPDGAKGLRLDSTIDELGIESIAALEMCGFIEQELDTQFLDSEIAAVGGMADLVRLIKKSGKAN